MDHRISKDMISSGMIPSGEKTQADLGRIQYGSAPSPSTLMDAYRSIYEHHQKDKDGNTIPHEGEQLNEGKMPEGLKNYLMKKKGKKEDKKEDMKKEGADLFDIVKSKLIDEGVDEKEALKLMVNASQEQLQQIAEMDMMKMPVVNVLGGLAAGAAAVKGAASYLGRKSGEKSIKKTEPAMPADKPSEPKKAPGLIKKIKDRTDATNKAIEKM